MKNLISDIEIKNFKSIKDLKISCKRINIFIGEPNVGKSNILESLSLFLAPFCSEMHPLLEEYIRYEKPGNLFYDQNRKKMIRVETNLGAAYVRYHLNTINQYDITIHPEKGDSVLPKGDSTSEMASDFSRRNPSDSIDTTSAIRPFYSTIKENQNFSSRWGLYNSPIKKYLFKPLSSHNNHFSQFLSPPHGDNLFSILEENPEIYERASGFFEKYGLDLLIDTESSKLDIQKRVGNRVYKIPYSMAADTLQRIIFYLAAVESNENSILLFEEPETNSFPPYITLLAENIIQKENNQFFITTHSPYILTPFIEQCSRNEVSIFICTYENYETKVRPLTDKEVTYIMDTGIDLFFNIPAFKK